MSIIRNELNGESSTEVLVVSNGRGTACKEVLKKILQLLKTRAVLRPADLDELSIPRVTLHRLYQQGQVEKIAHGLYRHTA